MQPTNYYRRENYMIQFIASDIDGTLLQNGAQELNPRVFELIRELKKYGIRFAASSGRQYSGIRSLFSPVCDEISYIAENGSLCLHDKKVLSRGLIERELGLRILEEIKSYGNCDCMVSCESRLYTDSPNQKFFSMLINDYKYDVAKVDDLRSIQEDFLKIALHRTTEPKAMQDHFKDYFKNEIKVVSSGDYWVDFIAPNANKATGLASVLEYFQIPPENCVAFGDQYNDVEMLQYAGTSYAMSGAAPGISYYSTYVTDSVEEVLEDILASAKLRDL